MPRPVCAIVGAGEGLGRSLAGKFAAEGFDIALISRSSAGSSAAARAAAEANREIEVNFFAADATEPETIELALGKAAADLGEIEVLIYNARGEFTRREPLEMSYAELEDIYRVEVVGAFAAAKSVLPAMREHGHGSVMFSSATAALRGSASHPLYAIGKFGLRALSQSLAKAYSKDGVHIVHVRLDCDLDVPLMRKAYGDRFNSENMAQPDDVAEAYWWAHQQPRSAWSNEIELRPYTEKWTY
ncbi:MAG: SDR family NAD(P)-dependent oxidoreductase [Hyphomicrobiales bacterium]|nr:SDR family NAD(P)-dependent oxidoreductase [Hyphomicrobiales bacterium]